MSSTTVLASLTAHFQELVLGAKPLLDCQEGHICLLAPPYGIDASECESALAALKALNLITNYAEAAYPGTHERLCYLVARPSNPYGSAEGCVQIRCESPVPAA